jgi:hypothetical protein
LAADERFPPVETRFNAPGIASTKEKRRTGFEAMFTAPGFEPPASEPQCRND